MSDVPDMTQCEAGCVPYTGGERRHHKDCIFYLASFTKMYDDLKATADARIAELERENLGLLTLHTKEFEEAVTAARNDELDNQLDSARYTVDVLTERRKSDHKKITELEGALSSAEIANSVSSDGNMWRFWRDKATTVAAKLSTARNDALEEAARDIGTWAWNKCSAAGQLSSGAVFTTHTWQDARDVVLALKTDTQESDTECDYFIEVKE